MHQRTNVFAKSLSLVAVFALVLASAGLPLGSATIARAAAPETVKVTIDKYIDGVQATAGSALSSDFPMSATWNAVNIGAGTGGYALGAGNTTPYEAVTADMTTGADYATHEVTDGSVVGASCTTGQPFALVGYTTGDTLAQAQAATPTMTVPTFIGLTADKFVIVWNHDCSAPTMVKVTVDKFVDGAMATNSSAASSTFPMTASWNDVGGIGAGTGSYTLSGATSPAYEAQTIDMHSGASYSTSEDLSGAVVGASCASGQHYMLAGYTSGNTAAEAATGTPSMTAPSFTNLSQNKFVTVWNTTCPTPGGSIGGDVTGGVSPHGTLVVTGVDLTDTSATADGTFGNGWKYTFHVTVPDNETQLAMKFANWMNTTSSSTIAVAGNVRISSAQANNASATVMVVAPNTYTTPTLHITGDLDPSTPGMQVNVLVEAAVPAGSVNGSYTTNYGVQTLP